MKGIEKSIHLRIVELEKKVNSGDWNDGTFVALEAGILHDIEKLKRKHIRQIEKWTNNVNWDLVNPYVIDYTLIDPLKEGKEPVKCLGLFKSKEI